MREAGIDMPSSCEQGACGTCLATVIEGEPDHQDVYLNRGWSPAGKRYREMERYCAQNEGTFFFSRLIYSDVTARPTQIEFGVRKADRTLWLEVCDNAGAA